jgi:octopine/nopaline transport system permease protein
MTEISFITNTLFRLMQGLPLTLELTAISVIVGGMIAVFLAVARRWWIGFDIGVRVFVFFFRGTPLLIQLYLIYYGIGQFRWIRQSAAWIFLREPFWCALLSLTLCTAAYATEVFRGGLQSVPQGAIEAGRVLGLSPWQLLRRIVLPIALRQALPAYGNEIIIMIKATSLTSVVTLIEVTGIAYQLMSETFRPIEVFVCAGLIYLTITLTLTRVMHVVERRLSPHLGDAPAGEMGR